LDKPQSASGFDSRPDYNTNQLRMKRLIQLDLFEQALGQEYRVVWPNQEPFAIGDYQLDKYLKTPGCRVLLCSGEFCYEVNKYVH